MVQLTQQQMGLIAPLFAYSEETLILSTIQGHMGKAWANSPVHPACAQIIVGDFCFLAGDAAHPAASELSGHFPASRASDWLLVVPENGRWEHWIKRCYPGRHEPITRYAIKKEPDCFDPARLRSFIDRLPVSYRLAPIDEALYRESFSHSFSQDFCSNFDSAEDYLRRGIGVGVLWDGQLVGGASSYTVYDSGIEIEIAIAPEHRRRGLATACAAQLILSCLDRGLYPSWDAANPESVALAEKLGYHLSHAYTAYAVARTTARDHTPPA